MMLEVGIATILVVLLDGILLRRRIDREKRKLAKQLGEVKTALKGVVGSLKRLSGINAQTQINSKIAQKMADNSFRHSQDAVLRVGALEKSTHRVQFITADQAIAKNLKAENTMNEIQNPSNEEFDWLNPVLSEDMDN